MKVRISFNENLIRTVEDWQRVKENGSLASGSNGPEPTMAKAQSVLVFFMLALMAKYGDAMKDMKKSTRINAKTSMVIGTIAKREQGDIAPEIVK